MAGDLEYFGQASFRGQAVAVPQAAFLDQSLYLGHYLLVQTGPPYGFEVPGNPRRAIIRVRSVHEDFLSRP